MKILILFITLLMFSCKEHYTREEVISMMRSKSPDSIMDACEYIIQTKDTSLYEVLLENPFRGRISHNIRHYGGSAYIYQIRTLEVLTGKKPPKEVTHIPDSSIVEFYRKSVFKK